LAGFKLDQDVDIRIGTKIVSQYGSEQSKLADMVPTAELRKARVVDTDFIAHP
jgi:hypothetical protein